MRLANEDVRSETLKKIGISILIICLYSFPFTYFSMYQDFINRSLVGYVIMIVATLLLAFLSKFYVNLVPMIVGNILSGFISLYFISRMMGSIGWDGYFKPASPNQLLIVVSFLNLIPQFIALKIAKRYKNKC